MPKRVAECNLRTPPRRSKAADSISTSHSSKVSRTRTSSRAQRNKQPSNSYPTLEQRKAEVQHLLDAKHNKRTVKFREEESRQIVGFAQRVRAGQKGLKFVMVTGSPGLGKTLTVRTSLRQRIMLIEINAYSSPSLQKVQEIIYERLFGQAAPKALTTQKLISTIRARKRQPAVVYLEEMEAAMKKPTNDCSSAFFELFAEESLGLGLIGVSNSLDFLSRYCRKGEHLILKEVQTIKFPQYTTKQIQVLLSDKLDQLMTEAGIEVEWEAGVLNYALNKVGLATGGDMRHAGWFIKKLVSRRLERMESDEVEESKTISIVISIASVKEIQEEQENRQMMFVHGQPLQLRLVLLAILFLLQRDEGCYAQQNDLVDALTRACPKRGIKCEKQLVRQWLKDLQSLNLVTLPSKAGSQGRVLLAVKGQHVQSSFQDSQAQMKNMQ